MCCFPVPAWRVAPWERADWIREVRVGKEVGAIMAPMSMFSLLLLLLWMGCWGWDGGGMEAPWRRERICFSRRGIKRS